MSASPSPHAAAPTWRRILVVRLDNMGDVLMCTPAMQALREACPRAHLTLLTSPAGARLAPHLGMVDELITHGAAWVKQPPGEPTGDEAALIERLRGMRFDAVFIFTTCTQSPLPMAMLCRMAGIPERIAHCRENPYGLLTQWVRETDAIGVGMRHEVQRQLDLVMQAGVAPPASTALRFDVLAADKAHVGAVLADAGWGKAPYLVLHPGASAPSRRYPPAAFADAVRPLLEQGWRCVLCAGPGEREEAEAVWSALPHTLHPQMLNLSGRLSLGQMAALIQGARLLIANNSGPMHIGAAVGTPIVCLYALTNPQHTPWGVPARVLSHEVPCRDCLRSVCPMGHHACLLNVAPRQVSDAALALLDADTHADTHIDAHLGPVKEIAVFRALGLGDLLCATPALRALRQRFPGARITLISLPWAAELAARLDSIDDFIAFPGHPSLPERQPDTDAWPAFVDKVRARRFDLLVQLHGSGRVTNGLVSQWGARHVAAFHEADKAPPDAMLATRWPEQGTESGRLMRLVDAFGAPAAQAADQHERAARWQLDFPLRPHDAEAARALLARHGMPPDAAGGKAHVCVHMGAQLPSRRWPVARFAAVARALHEQGHPLVLTGVAGERALAEALQAALPTGACIDLLGQTDLWTMGALIKAARLLICNDTGVSHVAAALGTPSVVISCGADVSRWAPADTDRHRVLWSDQPCRPCAHVECPTAHECAWDIAPASVLDAAQTLLAARA